MVAPEPPKKKESARRSSGSKEIKPAELSSKNFKQPAPVEPAPVKRDSGRQKKSTTKNAFQVDTEENENSVDESYYDNSIDND
jgi:hypothetical protein